MSRVTPTVTFPGSSGIHGGAKNSTMQQDLDDQKEEAVTVVRSLPGDADATKLVRLRMENRSIQQLLEQTSEVARRASRTTDGAVAHVQAQMFHAGNGIDVSRYHKGLDDLKLPTSVDPPRRIGETSVDAFLKNERHNALNIAISATQHETLQEFHGQHLRAMQNDWEREKVAIRELLAAGVDIPEAPTDYYYTNKNAQGIAMPCTDGNIRSTMDSDTIVYAKVVWCWVQAIMDNATFDVVEEFRKASLSLDDVRKADIAGAWEVVRAVMALPSDVGNSFANMDKSTPQESAGCWDSFRDSKDEDEVVSQHIVNAKRFLEARYVEYIIGYIGNYGKSDWYRVLVERLEQAPDAQERIRLRDDQERVWAHIYVCLRAGQLQAAREAAQQFSASDLSDVELDALHQGIDTYNTPSQARSDLHLPRSGSPRDFKRLVYTVLGLCTADHTGTTQFQNAHEWLWFKLNHVQRGTGMPPDVSHNAGASWLRTGFLEVQNKDVWEGTNRGEGFEPLLYFELLMLTAQFERAIEYLRAKQLSRLAVHIAIPLEHCGLLHTSNRLPNRVFGVRGNGSDTTPDRPAVNFGHLIRSYTRAFQHSNSQDAMRYYYLLRYYRWAVAPGTSVGSPRGAGGGADGTGAGMALDVRESLFVHCVTDMVVKNKEWVSVLGKYDAEGRKEVALVDAFETAWANEQQLAGDGKRQIICSVAHVAENEGKLHDAIRLYDLGDQRSRVLRLLNQKLGEDVADRHAHEDTSFFTFARTIAQNPRYRGVSVSDSAAGTAGERELLHTMLCLVDFFRLCFSNEPQHALDKLATLRDQCLIPTDMEILEECVQNFDKMPMEVLRNLPQILLFSMNCNLLVYQQLQGQHQHLMGGRGMAPHQHSEDGGSSLVLGRARQRARAIVTYAGRINYRMPGDTNAQLIRMELPMLS
eukprot:m.956728 g.956728  ORF g.956728 m.956728 type:complete len:925 (-) comp23874_c0_seq2:123-2897(-)